ncbi:hypothetical protein KIH74_05025 [Kineosporia sp. J2-2]|uniref:Uncharacterized protein n=1 Tax=Kineosporia corallincola TaxID=2835133 RepID=A0ABS5TB16_9ACTN|nr:hypothetical protein [Kineosporia corallincola]MBT0768273.1 hypothetical protein [Kineosporia corallincola]
MSTPRAPMTPEDYGGDPSEDATRLQDWCAFVPVGIDWLREQSGVQLDGSVESLGPLWGWVIKRLAQDDVWASVGELPAWALRRPYRYRVGELRPEVVWLWGALAAYFGEVFIARAAAPEVEWRILRHPLESVQEQGDFVLLRPAHIKRRKPRHWTSAHLVIGNLIAGQVKRPGPRDRPQEGRNDSDLLKRVFFQALEWFGEVVPELEPSDPVPGLEPADTLLGRLDAPEVAAARAVCPSRWVSIPEGLDDDDFTFTTEEVCQEVGFGSGDEGAWSLFLHDSIRPVVDVDVDDAQDPLLRTLRAHPLVVEAEHSDRELYEWRTRGEPSEGEMAALALTGLAAAQERALHLARG